MVTFRGGWVIFEREQGPPWQDVLTQMLEEQNSILGDNQDSLISLTLKL